MNAGELSPDFSLISLFSKFIQHYQPPIRNIYRSGCSTLKTLHGQDTNNLH